MLVLPIGFPSTLTLAPSGVLRIESGTSVSKISNIAT